MKKTIYAHVHRLLLFCLAVTLMLMSACKKNMESSAPVITSVRNYAASPNDTIVKTVTAGQWVVVIGRNLGGVFQASFGSTAASINSTFLNDTCVVIQIPFIPFQSVPRNKVNVITLVNAGGTANFEINITGTPIISRVKNAAAAPNDTILKSIVPNQLINIVGFNLKNATNISFQGVAADLTNVAYSDSSATVRVPAVLSGGDASLANTISYTTKYGTSSFPIKIIGPPIITNISYEIPKQGDIVYIYGNNFISVKNLSFAGTPITSYTVLADSIIKFTAPSLSNDGGPAVIETRVGTFTTAYKVNDVNFINNGGVGIIGNMEWGDYFGWPWWGGNVSLTSSDPNSGWPSYNADFGVGLGMYMEYKSDKLDGGAGNDGNALRMNNAKSGWVPSSEFN